MYLNTFATDTVSSTAKIRHRHLLIELKAAVKGEMNQTSKLQVPGGALLRLKTKHVLAQKSWTPSHFPISRFFFHLLKISSCSKQGRRAKAPGGETCQTLSTLQGNQQTDPGPMAVSATGLQTLWSSPWWRAPGPLLRQPRWHHSSVQGPNISKHTWSIITFYTPYRGRRTWHYSLTQPTLELFRRKLKSPNQEPDPPLLPTG